MDNPFKRNILYNRPQKKNAIPAPKLCKKQKILKILGLNCDFNIEPPQWDCASRTRQQKKEPSPRELQKKSSARERSPKNTTRSLHTATDIIYLAILIPTSPSIPSVPYHPIRPQTSQVPHHPLSLQPYPCPNSLIPLPYHPTPGFPREPTKSFKKR